MSVFVTNTEYEVVRRVHGGLSYKAIARELDLAGAGSVGARVWEVAHRIPGAGSPKFKVLRTPFPAGFSVFDGSTVKIYT